MTGGALQEARFWFWRAEGMGSGIPDQILDEAYEDACHTGVTCLTYAMKCILELEGQPHGGEFELRTLYRQVCEGQPRFVEIPHMDVITQFYGSEEPDAHIGAFTEEDAQKALDAYRIAFAMLEELYPKLRGTATE